MRNRVLVGLAIAVGAGASLVAQRGANGASCWSLSSATCASIHAWSWVKDDARAIIVLNYGHAPAQGRVHVAWDELRARPWRLDEVLSGNTYDRDGNDMRESGLYVDLGPWQSHLFQLRGL